MNGKIVITLKDGTTQISHFDGDPPIKELQRKYMHVATEWDYSARVGNPIILYFKQI